MPVPDGRVAVMYAEWIGHPETGVDEIAVLTVLALHADRDGICWPSQGLLARLLNRSRSWVNKMVNRLCEIGLLAKTRRHRDDGGNRSCLYQLLRPAAPATPTVTAPADGEGAARRGGSLPHPGSPADQGVSFGDSPGSGPRQVKEPDQTNKDSPALAAADRIDPIALDSKIPPPLPPDWQPSDDDLLWAARRFPGYDLSHHTERFINRCQAKGYAYRDPGAAWRAWLLDDVGDGRSPAMGCGQARRVGPGRPGAGSALHQRWQVWGELAAMEAAHAG